MDCGFLEGLPCSIATRGTIDTDWPLTFAKRQGVRKNGRRQMTMDSVAVHHEIRLRSFTIPPILYYALTLESRQIMRAVLSARTDRIMLLRLA